MANICRMIRTPVVCLPAVQIFKSADVAMRQNYSDILKMVGHIVAVVNTGFKRHDVTMEFLQISKQPKGNLLFSTQDERSNVKISRCLTCRWDNMQKLFHEESDPRQGTTYRITLNKIGFWISWRCPDVTAMHAILISRTTSGIWGRFWILKFF